MASSSAPTRKSARFKDKAKPKDEAEVENEADNVGSLMSAMIQGNAKGSRVCVQVPSSQCS